MTSAKTYNEDISYHGGYANYNFAWQLAKLKNMALCKFNIGVNGEILKYGLHVSGND